MESYDLMVEFMKGLKTKRRGDRFILDEWCSDYYLIFDGEASPEDPEAAGTVDILVAQCGVDPRDSDKRVLLKRNCTRHQIATFLLAIGIDRFSEETRQYVVSSNNSLQWS